MPRERLSVVVTRRLPEPVETRLSELFDVRLRTSRSSNNGIPSTGTPAPRVNAAVMPKRAGDRPVISAARVGLQMGCT